MSSPVTRDIFIASDHAGYDLKSKIVDFIKEKKINIIDLGTHCASNSVDYPDYANKLSDKIVKNSPDLGILICGSGVGISIAANRHKNIRAALCFNEKMAELSRAHNDANVLCLGARIINDNEVLKIVETFLNGEFESGRHALRVQKIS